METNNWLDALSRRAQSNANTTWENYHREQTRQLLREAESAEDWIGLSANSNGYVREVAVRTLAQHRGPAALAALIERLNDWVPQVRDVARLELNHYLTDEHLDALLHCLERFVALEQRGRTDHRSTLEAVRQVIGSTQRDRALQALRAKHGRSARFLFESLLRSDSEQEPLLLLALDHMDVSVQRLAVAAVRQLPADKARALTQHALQKTSASIRCAALRVWLELAEEPAQVQGELKKGLLDGSAAIRGLARWAAPKWGVDCTAVLLERLAQPLPSKRREWMGLVGLARELREPRASRMLEQALQTGGPHVRLMALDALALIEGEKSLPRQLKALEDDSEKIFTFAANWLGRQSLNSFDEQLTDLMKRTWHQLSPRRRNVMLRLKPHWQQLAFLLDRMKAAPLDEEQWLPILKEWGDSTYGAYDHRTPASKRQEWFEELSAMERSGRLPTGILPRLR